MLPQAAQRLDADPAIGPDEVAIAVERLNLDAASFRQLREACRGRRRRRARGGARHRRRARQDAEPGHRLRRHAHRRRRRGRPGVAAGPRRRATGSPRWSRSRSPRCGSPTAWPAGTGAASRCPPRGRRSCSPGPSPRCCPTTCPTRSPSPLLDVCGAPAVTARVVERSGARSVAVLGAAGKSGSPEPGRRPPRRRDPADRPRAHRRRGRGARRRAGLADQVVVADARDPLAVAAAVGEPADLTVVCVDVPGAEHGAVLATADGGTVIFFSMATSFTAAALGAEGMAADVTMLVGNGYTPGHAALALDLYRSRAGGPGAGRPAGARMTLLITDVTDRRPARPGAAGGRRRDRLDRRGRRRPDAPTGVVDGAGALLTPAFVDAHAHATGTGLALTGLDLSSRVSLRDALVAVAEHAARTPTGTAAGHRLGRDGVARGARADPARPRRRGGGPAGLPRPGRRPLGHRLHRPAGPGAGDRGAARLRRRRPAAHRRPPRRPAGGLRLGRPGAAAGRPAGDARRGGGAGHRRAARDVAARRSPAPRTSPALLALAAERPGPAVVGYWGELSERGGLDVVRELGLAGAGGDLFCDGAFGSHTAALTAPYTDRPETSGALRFELPALVAARARLHPRRGPGRLPLHRRRRGRPGARRGRRGGRRARHGRGAGLPAPPRARGDGRPRRRRPDGRRSAWSPASSRSSTRCGAGTPACTPSASASSGRWPPTRSPTWSTPASPWRWAATPRSPRWTRGAGCTPPSTTARPGRACGRSTRSTPPPTAAGTPRAPSTRWVRWPSAPARRSRCGRPPETLSAVLAGRARPTCRLLLVDGDPIGDLP